MSQGQRTANRGFGVAAALPHDVIREIARESELAGYTSFWVNDTPNGDGLQAVAEAARETTLISLGVGVIALSRKGPAEIAEQARSLNLPLDRLYLGVGSGVGGVGALRRVREGVRELKDDIATRIFVAALGPKMCRLAGEEADGVLYNWLTPEYTERSNELVLDGAQAMAKPQPILAGYVRCALGSGARAVLEKEAARYDSIPAYASHFQQQGVPKLETAVAVDSAEELQSCLAAWEPVLDDLVVRSIAAHDTVDEILELLRAAAPGE